MIRPNPYISMALASCAALTLSAEPKSMVVDTSASSIEIVVKSTIDSFTGKLPVYAATIQIEPSDHHIASVDFEFKFADIKTGNSGRDEAMRDWEEVTTHPDGSFKLKSLTPATGEKLTASGTLILHGTPREISFPVTVKQSGDNCTIDGSATLDTRDFGLPIIKKFMVLKVDPEVLVRFHLQGKVAGS
jgi:polyisoprenoid-binding protein YceI